MANSVDIDEVAHYEPSHQDLRCLRIQLFSALAVKGRFLKFRRYHNFANLFSESSETTLYKEISKFQ